MQTATTPRMVTDTETIHRAGVSRSSLSGTSAPRRHAPRALLSAGREKKIAERQAFLRQVPLFADLLAEEYRQLAAILRERHYKKHEVIFHTGDPGDALFLLTRGLVKITVEAADWHELIVVLLSHEDFFGEMALVDALPRSATATALEPSQVLVLERDSFVALLECTPRLVRKLAQTLGRRLRKANELIHSLAFLDAHGKVARVLLTLVQNTEQAPAGGSKPALQLTQRTLAELAGTSRETTTRVLGDLQQAGYLRLKSGTITILEPAMLAQMAHVQGCNQTLPL